MHSCQYASLVGGPADAKKEYIRFVTGDDFSTVESGEVTHLKLMKYYGEEMTSAVHYVFTSTEATIDKFEVEQELFCTCAC